MSLKNSHTAVKFRCHLDYVLAGVPVRHHQRQQFLVQQVSWRDTTVQITDGNDSSSCVEQRVTQEL